MRKYIFYCLFGGLLFVGGGFSVYAQEPSSSVDLPANAGAYDSGRVQFNPLDGTGITGFTDIETARTLGGFLNAGYQLLIGIASVLAVLMIFYAGFRYATTTSSGAKTDAKNRILGALGGLLLALSSYLILSTIDTGLVDTDLAFQDFEEEHLHFDVTTEEGREAMRRAYQPKIIVNEGRAINTQSANGSIGTIGGVPTGATVTFPSGAQFQAIAGGVIDGIDYTDGGGGRFARGVPLIDTQGRLDEKLSQNFTLRDFQTKDGARYARVSRRIVEGLENIRSRVGSAITITSGYRHPAYNKRVSESGTTGSHTAGHAIDIQKVPSLSYEQLARIVIDEFGCNIGLGMGGNMVHFDFRGVHQSWAYTGYTNAQVDNFYDDYCKGKY